MDDITGRVALVTGGSRGIGRAICLALAEIGADVAVNYRRNDSEAEKVCVAIRKRGRRALKMGADVGSASEVARLVTAVRENLGSVDIVVNNAGIARPVTLDTLTEEVWDETIATNLKSAFLVTQAVLPEMRKRKWGRIINISSTAAQTGGLVGPHYASSKAGIHGLTHSYASLLAREGITANTVAPALIDTDMVRNSMKATPERIPIGRFGHVDEVGKMVAMLACNGYITGQTININGGVYMS